MKSVAILIILLVASISFASHLPSPAGYVNDFANVLPDRAYIEQQLGDYEKNTTIEIAVVTIESLPEDQTAATYAVELFQEWGIGKKGEDNGILVLIVTNGTTGNRMRIELGYGIQGYITGAEAGRILDKALPSYEKRDYQGATAAILLGLSEQLRDYVPGNVQGRRGIITNEILINVLFNLPLIFFVGGIILSAFFAGRCPNCGSRSIDDSGGYTVCRNCGRRIRKRRGGFVFIPAGGYRGGGGFGGFGGGSSGGGGAGR